MKSLPSVSVLKGVFKAFNPFVDGQDGPIHGTVGVLERIAEHLTYAVRTRRPDVVIRMNRYDLYGDRAAMIVYDGNGQTSLIPIRCSDQLIHVGEWILYTPARSASSLLYARVSEVTARLLGVEAT